MKARMFSYLEKYYDRFSERQQKIKYREIIERVVITTNFSEAAIQSVYSKVLERGFPSSFALATIDLLDLEQRT